MAETQTIWFSTPNPDELNQRGLNTAVERLGIQVTGIGDDYLQGSMPVDHRTCQPLGLLHGGASVLLAESLGSMAANYCVDQSKAYCVGMEINANHLRSVHEGEVIGIARPLHLGGRSQVWEIKIQDPAGRMICISRLTMAVVEKNRP